MSEHIRILEIKSKYFNRIVKEKHLEDFDLSCILWQCKQEINCYKKKLINKDRSILPK